MILYVPPNAPAVIKDAAAVILVAHIGGGSLGVVSGFTAFLTRKGGVVHRLAGDIFVVSMLVMASIGAVVSPFLPTPQPGNIAGGVLTLYVVRDRAPTGRKPGRLADCGDGGPAASDPRPRHLRRHRLECAGPRAGRRSVRGAVRLRGDRGRAGGV